MCHSSNNSIVRVLIFVLLGLVISFAPGGFAQAASLEGLVTLDLGEERTSPIQSDTLLHVDDPSVVEVELQSSEGTFKIKGLSKGASLLFLHGSLGLSALRVVVGPEKSDPRRQELLTKAKSSCSSFKENPNGFEVFIDTKECQASIAELSPHFLSEKVRVKFNEIGIRSQLESQHAALERQNPSLAARLSLAYMGATLRVSGQVQSIQERDEALRAIWYSTAGRMLVDLHKLEVLEEGKNMRKDSGITR